MPARVVAEVRPTPTGRFKVGCGECDWFPDFYFDATVADADAVAHNIERHDGTDGNFTLVELTEDADDRLRRYRVLTIGHLALITVAVVLLTWTFAVVQPHDVAQDVAHGAAMGVLGMQAYWLGRLRVLADATSLDRRAIESGYQRRLENLPEDDGDSGTEPE